MAYSNPNTLVIAASKANTYRMMGCSNLYLIQTNVNKNELKRKIDAFLKDAEANPEITYQITATLGDDDEIAPMFALSPPNCMLPRSWRDIAFYSEEHKWWS